ncbi:transcriptional regulator with XRE-family HTH domain [Catalinimonas alkaloidigena]|uniref:helix-turn-helix domain-containing protein n=1 Tax=Catalinimonas alkaloidigena TaxID=1075417 RepID=UPI002404D10D|nr:helix-turn-helix transcriptional regulator [Catalinimonas alkaloidigena]MDF9795002.1 transcriptional regulator with XRE-family HTH domain [Catalinimonas alkaloidigena]
MNTASQNIRYLRRKYQFTQEQMAQKLGIKRSLLGAYEEARANPRLEVLVKAAELFNVSVDQLVSKPLSKPLGEPQKSGQSGNIHSGTRQSRTIQSENIHSENIHSGNIHSGNIHSGTHHTRMQQTHEEEADDAFYGEHLSGEGKSASREANKLSDESDTYAHQPPAKRPYLPPRKINFPASESKKALQRVRLVVEGEFKQYFYNAVEREYLETLPELTLPLPSSADQYRAFEIIDDAMRPLKKGAIAVGCRIESIQKLKDGKPHILITRTEGILFRRVYNHIARSGNLLLEANHPAYERISLPVLGKEVEAWEVVLYISADDPYQFSPVRDNNEAIDLPRLTSIVLELQQEVMKLKENL